MVFCRACERLQCQFARPHWSPDILDRFHVPQVVSKGRVCYQCVELKRQGRNMELYARYLSPCLFHRSVAKSMEPRNRYPLLPLLPRTCLLSSYFAVSPSPPTYAPLRRRPWTLCLEFRLCKVDYFFVHSNKDFLDLSFFTRRWA